MSERWTSHILWRADAVSSILRTLVCHEDRQTTLIIGQGFDPRMNDCLTLLKEISSHRLRVFGLQIGRASFGDDDGDLPTRAARNLANLKSALSENDIFEVVNTAYEDEDRDSTAPSASDKAIEFARELIIYSGNNVIVDISSLPQGGYFPILEVFLGQRAEEFKQVGASLYVFVSENAVLDAQITQLELQEDAYLVPPFRSAFTGTGDERTIVWFPVMGEREKQQIQRVQKLLLGVECEVCPILPMPSSDPRRADNLIREYQDILQDTWRIDARSYIYSAEQNPFHLYRQITKTALRYQQALEQIGGCRAVISSHSSKLLSLGALMAASELNAKDFAIGLANVDATHYSVRGELPDQVESTFFLVPLLGEVYDE